MDKKQRDRIIKRHSHSIWMYGDAPQALYWENREVQELRFEVLLSCGVLSGDSVLDVGCGFADLYHYLSNKGLDVDYTGIDLSPDMIERAKVNSPSLTLFHGDLFDFNPDDQSYDWVLLSGALNEPLEDNGVYLKKMLPRLYSTCRKGLAFNLLNANFPWQARESYFLQPYHPEDVMNQLSQLSSHTKLRTDYMDLDVSYFAWRNECWKPICE